MLQKLRSALALAAMLAALGGCISTPIGRAGPPQNAPCAAAAYSAFVGAPLAAATFPEGVRVIGPDTIVTQDYVPARLNVLVDAKGVIAGFRCG